MAEQRTMSKRDQNLAQIREKATEIAERIVLEQGRDALSARGLAAEIGVSVGSLYNAVGDLETLLRTVIAKSAGILSRALETAVASAPQDKRARLVALGEAYFDFALTEPQRWWLLFEYRAHAVPDQKMQDFQARLLEMLIRAGEGDVSSDRHRQVFLQLWASVHGLVTLACRPTIVTVDPVEARTYIGELVDTGLHVVAES
ncbi:TetR/AcrR family transcriptional regulator [Dinoroseobacter sp. S124A]|uniref:TetR/AcrR family transcriptional regulator n=1 Tax=Dinoroseobacter sp. S124A TaxID=3415128 RepID=UPI003C7C5B24